MDQYPLERQKDIDRCPFAFPRLSLFRNKSWHTARSQLGRKRHLERRARAFRNDHLKLGQGRHNAPRLPITCADNIGNIAARKAAAIKQRLQNIR